MTAPRLATKGPGGTRLYPWPPTDPDFYAPSVTTVLGKLAKPALVPWAAKVTAEQAASLEEYFRRQGRDERVERAWPIVPDGLVRTA